MKKIFKILFVIFILFFSNKAFANICTDNIIIQNKCTNANCFSTETSYVGSEDNFLILENTGIVEVNNFKTWLNGELQSNIIDVYGGEFIIENFCTDSQKTDCADKSFTLDDLINNTKSSFVIDKGLLNDAENYTSGRHYFFTHFNLILTELKGKDVNLTLSDIALNLKHYVNVSGRDKYSISNICEDTSCNESEYSFFFGDDENNYKILTGNKASKKGEDYSDFSFINVAIPYSHSKIKIGENIGLNMKFVDNRSQPSCAESIYKYDIKYTIFKNGVESDKLNLLSDEIKVDKDGNNLTVNAGIEYTKINPSNLLEVSLKESISVPKIGKVFFYIIITDASGRQIEKKINNIAIDLVSGNPKSDKSEIIFVDFDVNQSYYKKDIFTTRIYLKDQSENSYGDENYGIKISHPDTNLIFNGSTNNTLENLKSNTDPDGKHYFEFSYSFLQTGNYSKEFLLTIPVIDIDGNKTGDNTMFNIGNFSEKINIRPIIVSKIKNLRCDQTIKVEVRCIWDDFSGCKISSSERRLFDNESENGLPFSLKASDNAGNRFIYNGIMDHIDRTPPLVEFIGLDFASLSANESTDFKFKISDAHPGGCRDISKVKYKIFVNKNNTGYVEQGSEVEIDNIKTQVKEIEIAGMKHIFKESGNYKIKIVAEDAVGNIQEYIKEFTIYPSTDISTTYSSISVSANGNAYANNSDYYTYTLKLKDKYNNPIYNKSVISIDQNINGYTGGETILKNMVKHDGSFHVPGQDALIEEYSGKTNADGELIFTLKSITPGDFTQRFKVIVNKWKDDYTDIFEEVTLNVAMAGNNSFKKPFEGILNVSDDNGVTWNGKPEIGTSKKYRFKLIDNGSTGVVNPSLKASVSAFSFLAGHVGEGYIDQGNYEFSLRINANSNVLSAPRIYANNLEIYYLLGSSESHYRLDSFGIGGNGVQTLGLKVTGILQSDGEGEATGQTKNFSDLSKAELRKDIRKNAYQYIKAMEHGDILNRVKYIDGADITLSNTPTDYDVLIIKNGNLIIDGDLDVTKKLGIVVLKDNYSALKDYSNKGNIYIKPNVRKIIATLYADGGVISAKVNGMPYIFDSTERTKALNKQLLITGFLFTRNTIGGAILGSGNTYTLPGGKVTGDFNKAMIYDLNYLRRGNTGCIDIDLNGVCEKSKPIHIDPRKDLVPSKFFDIK